MWTGSDRSGNLEFAQFTIQFNARQHKVLKLHLSADNQYKLYLDGKFFGSGPQKGDVYKWYFDTYHFTDLDSGEHTISILVFCNTYLAPTSQVSVRPALLAVAEDHYSDLFNNHLNWRCRTISSCKPLMVPEDAMHAGSGFEMSGFTEEDLSPSADVLGDGFSLAGRLLLGEPKDFRSMVDSYWGWRLTPRTVPALTSDYGWLGQIVRSNIHTHREKQETSSEVIASEDASFPIRIPVNATCRLLIDRKTLVKGFPILNVTGGHGATIRLKYYERLEDGIRWFGTETDCGEANESIPDAVEDRFVCDGRENCMFEPLTDRCWRYIYCEITTDGHPVHINSMRYRSHGYPYQFTFELNTDSWIERLVKPSLNTLRLCAADTFLDCPYYERLQYIGDTRIQALLSYALAGDDKLARQAIDAFDRSRLPNGLTQSRYPSRSRQVIPTFSLLYVSILHDFMMWRGDIDFLKPYLPGLRLMFDSLEVFENRDGLLSSVPGWLFVDWSCDKSWRQGMPPVETGRVNYLFNLQYLYAITHASELYRHCGDTSFASDMVLKAERLRCQLSDLSFDTKRVMFTDDSSHQNFSQHMNILAILTNTHRDKVDGLDLIKRILDDRDIAKVSCYFAFYLFEAMHKIGHGEMIWPELAQWHNMLDRGLTTFPEKFGKARSDCHGWSAHPLYHIFATLIGIRPADVGYGRVSFEPAMNNLEYFKAKLPHPKGFIDVDLKQSYGIVSGQVTLPQGVEWVRRSADQTFAVNHSILDETSNESVLSKRPTDLAIDEYIFAE